jgi:hypothetical protein
MATHTVLFSETRLPAGAVPTVERVRRWLLDRGIVPENVVVSPVGVSFDTPDGREATRAAAALVESWASFDDSVSRATRARQLWGVANALPQSTTAERFVKADAKFDALAVAVDSLLRDQP